MAVSVDENDDDVMSEINITPLTDVLLVLLIIFMITATFISRTGFNINLPQARTKEQSKPTEVKVFITKEGKVFSQGQWIRDRGMEESLKELLSRSKGDRLVIEADKDVNYGLVITVMDRAKKAGFSSIALAARLGGP